MVTSMSCRRFPILAITLAALAIAPAAAGAMTITPRIVGGGTVSTSTYPWQALVTMENDTGPYMCGGVILSATRVATAAHCVVGFSNFKVYAGVDSLPTSATPVPAAAADAMPTYDADTDINDAAVLTLGTPGLTLAGNVQSIPLVAPAAYPSAGTPLTVSGYGELSESGPAATSLQGATVNAVADDVCQADYARTLSPITRPDLVLCAAATNPDRDACYGDSGGPLVTQTTPPVLVGIVNSGSAAPNPAFPGIYAEVADPAINAFLAGRAMPTKTTSAPPLSWIPRPRRRRRPRPRPRRHRRRRPWSPPPRWSTAPRPP